ncbi:alpha/beta fold hydrolase [Streptomyces sp. NPDC029721]|uniref:alpha/beta fold hydrolase n=1 Tax=Streptomyces sp. NPDC029721 TaxID=3157090 RepID=UPI0033CE5B06
MRYLRKLASAVFSPVPVSRDRALGISERLSALTTLSSSLEYLHQRKQLDPGGLNDWDIMKKSPESKNLFIRRVSGAVAGKHVTLALHASRAAVSAGLLLPGNSRWRGAGSLFLGATTCLLAARHRYGTDGSDQVATLVQGATGLARLSTSPQTKDAFLWYVALQANLSYAASGWVKLIGERWRDASALPGVMRTRTYGSEGVYRLTQRYPRTSKYLQHGVLAMECLFPVVYLAGGRLTRPFLASAVGFHVANGFVMGLGRFMTAFPSLHPMVAYTTVPASHPAVAGRDDRAVKAAAVLLAAGVALSAAVAVQRRAAVLEGWPTSRKFVTRHGNELMYETGGAEFSEEPVLVFCAGLASTSEHFSWITERFVNETEHAVVSYARAGYGGSLRRTTVPYELAESVDDLEDLVRGVVPADRRVVLVGHSLGGELIRRAAARLGDRVAGLVYLDPAHPAELQRSQRQSKGAKDLRDTIAHASLYLRLGTGVLMSRPDWLDRLPKAYRERVFAQYTDARLWKAGKREWEAVEKEFRAFDGRIDPIGAPGLIIAAQQTVDQDPEQLLLYNELAHAHQDQDEHGGPGEDGGLGGLGGIKVVEGSDHDSLLTNAPHAHRAADLIAEFLGGVRGAGVRQEEHVRQEQREGVER